MSGYRPNTSRPEQWLAEAAWVRRLALQLVGDVSRAEDLAQDTWVRMLSQPPGEGPVRGWIATVMRNLWRSQRRGEVRRVDRERQVARSAIDDSADLLEKAASHREVVRAVMELDEPYRTTVLLRFVEDLPPRRIAARQGVPVATVKSRLTRGLERLRVRLDREYGDRSWLAALAPLARWPEGPASGPLMLGVLAVSPKVFLAVAAVVVAGISYVALSGPDPENATGLPGESGTVATPQPEVVEATGPRVGGPVASSTERQALPAPEGVATEPQPGDVRHVTGRVIDLGGQPVVAVEVVAERAGTAEGGDTAAATTGADGRFRLALPRGSGNLGVRDPRWATVLAGRPVSEDTGAESVVVAAPRIAVAGRVVDRFGAGLASATVELLPPESLRADLSAVLDYSESRRWHVAADERGEFSIAEAPALSGGQLRVSCEGFLTRTEAAPMAANEGMLLVLERPGAQRMLQGLVVDAGDVPVEGAHVSMGIDTVQTDAQGRFEFSLDAEQSFNKLASRFLEVEVDALVAVKEGYLPGRLARVEDHGDDPADGWPQLVVLRLGGPPLAISGTVVDETGEPMAGRRVWIADPTFFGGLGDPAGGRFPDLVHVESMIGGAEPGWHWVETDSLGRFRIDGLLDREYALQAMDPDTLLRTELANVRGGRSGIQLQLSGEGLYREVRGQVVDSTGRGVAGVNVHPMCDAFLTEYRGRRVGTQHHTVEGVVTDRDGRFELRRVPRALAYLRLDGADIVPLEWGRHLAGGLTELIGDTPLDLSIPVGRRCHFQVQLDSPTEADQVAVLDAAGEPLTISEFLGSGRREGRRQRLQEGRSGSLGVADTGRTLVLFRDGVEVRRIPLHLTPGERTVVR